MSMSQRHLSLCTDLVLDTWFHSALVFRQSQISVFVDGMEYSNYDAGNYDFANARKTVVIGRRNTDIDNNYASVTVDELMLWNVDVSQATIEMLISDTPWTKMKEKTMLLMGLCWYKLYPWKTLINSLLSLQSGQYIIKVKYSDTQNNLLLLKTDTV